MRLAEGVRKRGGGLRGHRKAASSVLLDRGGPSDYGAASPMIRADQELIAVSRSLCSQVEELRFAPPVTHVYNPFRYARAPWERYLERYGSGRKEVVLLGMNPGPFGMVQSGVPFGDVGLVRDWLGIVEPVHKPPSEHPKRPVLGFASSRVEISGSRLWGWARDRFGTPERFFARFFVTNYCPLAFLEESGRNRTPTELPRAERDGLELACDEALRASVEVLRPRLVVGVGAYARRRAERCLGAQGWHIASIPHPSPASPLANRGWAAQADSALRELGVEL
jgi:single-strand selective monofunctional uracil DNA glycosylase